jgi:hypothetical protein
MVALMEIRGGEMWVRRSLDRGGGVMQARLLQVLDDFGELLLRI